MILEWIRSGLKKRKVKVFLIILAFSALAWFINNLSFSYNSNTYFELDYVNTPKELSLTSEPKNKIDVKLRALGFQFLGFELRKKKVSLDMSKMKRKDSIYYISPDIYRRQIEAQLPSSMTLLEIEDDTLFFDFNRLVTKEVLVIPRFTFSLAANYMLEDSIKVNPPTVKVTGAKNEIDTVTGVRTSYLNLENLDNDFLKNIALVKPKSLETAVLSIETVAISGKVFRFSEKIIKVPVTVIALPNKVKVRTFPDSIQVVCQGKLENMKELEINDFQVIADYANISGAANNTLPITLTQFSDKVNNARLLINEIEFILLRE